MTKKLLLANDLVGYGKVGLGAMMPVLTRMGYDLFTLPTALVSNTLDYGKFQVLDTTEHLERTLDTWDELGLSFDAVAVGMVCSERQANLLADLCESWRDAGVPVFVDPVMGDGGRLYNGIAPEATTYLRRLVAAAEVALPNYTEACLLTGAPYAECQGMADDDVMRLLDCLRRLGARSVVVTSAIVDGGPAVVGYDHERDERFTIPFEELPAHFPGTGDVFVSVLVGKKLAGLTLEDATAYAMHVVKDLIRANGTGDGSYKGIPIERFLEKTSR